MFGKKGEKIKERYGVVLVGISTVVEKSFEGGRTLLANWGVPIYCSAVIIDMADGLIKLAD